MASGFRCLPEYVQMQFAHLFPAITCAMFLIILRRVCDGFRPPLPAGMPHAYAELLNCCWAHEPALRPRIDLVVQQLQVSTHVLSCCFPPHSVVAINKLRQGKG
jgi:hypothetical protein